MDIVYCTANDVARVLSQTTGDVAHSHNETSCFALPATAVTFDHPSCAILVPHKNWQNATTCASASCHGPGQSSLLTSLIGPLSTTLRPREGPYVVFCNFAVITAENFILSCLHLSSATLPLKTWVFRHQGSHRLHVSRDFPLPS